MPANYMAVDGLTHARENLNTTLDWVHEYLADHYGLELIDGEEYLPEPLNEVMAALYSVANAITDTAVEVGAYHRENGTLMRPIHYSNGVPVYIVKRDVDGVEVHALAHPGAARRAGLHLVDGGAN